MEKKTLELSNYGFFKAKAEEPVARFPALSPCNLGLQLQSLLPLMKGYGEGCNFWHFQNVCLQAFPERFAFVVSISLQHWYSELGPEHIFDVFQ